MYERTSGENELMEYIKEYQSGMVKPKSKDIDKQLESGLRNFNKPVRKRVRKRVRKYWKDIVYIGKLYPQEEESFEIVLREDRKYHIYVDATDPSVDFDLHVYGEDDALVASDDHLQADAQVEIEPHRTGPYRLQVRSVKGVSEFVVLVYEYR
jgi:hypothetical protein